MMIIVIMSPIIDQDGLEPNNPITTQTTVSRGAAE